MLQAYEGFDAEPNAVSVLTGAALQLQRADAYDDSIAKDGLMLKDRFGQLKENPAAVGERAAWNTHRLLCRELGVEPAAPKTTSDCLVSLGGPTSVAGNRLRPTLFMS
jgi:hypothetical protein